MRHGPPDPAPQLNPVAGFRVLIVKTSFMGDVVHAMPAVTDIAGQRPGALIDWLVESPKPQNP